MAEDTHCDLPDRWMGDNFCGQRRDALNGHGHKIEDAWGKASLSIANISDDNDPVPKYIVHGHHAEHPRRAKKCKDKIPRDELRPYCRIREERPQKSK